MGTSLAEAVGRIRDDSRAPITDKNNRDFRRDIEYFLVEWATGVWKIRQRGKGRAGELVAANCDEL